MMLRGMNPLKPKLAWVAFAALLWGGLATSSTMVLGGEYSIDWSTIDGGGGVSTGGGYELSGTIGQPDAGEMSGGTYTLNGGFWAGGAAPQSVCVPDINHDEVVNGSDLAIVLGGWGPGGAFGPADLNEDGTVDGSDLALVLGGWGPCPD